MEVLAYTAFAYLAVRLIVALVNLLSRSYLPKGRPGKMPRISVLIPARNEEANLGALLDDLKKIDYPDLQILVYDDDSKDRTAGIILERSGKDSRIGYLKSEGLPEGWLGKNYACDRLAREANGDYLLFLDADVRVSAGLFHDSISFMEKHDLSLLSIFPVQIMKSFGEWLTVPLMNRILTGNLPLFLVRKSRLPDFAAANGQFMLFKAEIYRKHWFHEEFRKEKVEDIRIIRKMKKLNYKVSTLLSSGQISCRMYTGYREGLVGFSKNIHAFFGSNWLILFLFIIITTLGPFAVWFTFPVQIFIIFMLTLYLTMFVISIQSRQSSIINLLLFPFQQITTVITSILAAYRNISGKMQWKGRNIQ